MLTANNSGGISEIKNWIKNVKTKNYAHFDERISKEKALKYLSNSENIVSHAFYPFIYFKKETNKYKKGVGILKKERELLYCGHLDRYIYSWYANILNQRYNQRVVSLGINEVAIAYRTNLKKSNINFAKEAFNYIKSLDECTILLYDFKNFFGSINHMYLKERICGLIDKNYLPDDIYAVYKNITKYSWWDIDSLLLINNLIDTDDKIKKLNQKRRVLSIEQFKEHKKDFLKFNNAGHGIPQGSPISAVLSNIYMIDFDKDLNRILKDNSGLYLRYSDDIIMVIPSIDKHKVSEFIEKFSSISKKIPNLEIQEEKTKIYQFKKAIVKELDGTLLEPKSKNNCSLDYLGFEFNGKNIYIRQKTISRYYKKLQRNINRKRVISKRFKISKSKLRKEIYNKYSIKGTKHGESNFITYLNRSTKIMETSLKCPTINSHLGKIKKKLSE